MPIDTSIPMQVKPFDLGEVVDLQSRVQNLRKLRSEKAVGEATQQATDEEGNIDWQKRNALVAADPRAAYSAAPAADEAQAQRTAQLQQHAAQLDRHAQIAGGLAMTNAPASEAYSAIDNELKSGFIDDKTARQLHAKIAQADTIDDPVQRRQALRDIYQGVWAQTQQGKDAMLPNWQETQNVGDPSGATKQVGVQRVDTNPMSLTYGKKTWIPQKPSEGLFTTTTPEGAPAVTTTSKLREQIEGKGQVQTGPSETEKKQIDTASDDFAKTQQSQKEYGKVHSDQQNIQSLVRQGATTGNFSAAKNALYGSLSAIIPGLDSATDQKARNDLIEKFMNQAGIDKGTDQAQSLRLAANPHQAMAGDAIIEASRYVDAIKKYDGQEKYDFVKGITGNYQKYNETAAQYHSLMNPTVMMYLDMPKNEREAWLSKQPQDMQSDIIRRKDGLNKLRSGIK